ncbi:MAG TPA: hypothetical protein V6C50_12980, partial [Crinalium sp.]
MAISLPVVPNQEWLRDDICPTVQQASLKEFVHQFEFVGGSLSSSSPPHYQSRQATYWAEPSESKTLPLETLIEWTHLSEA